MLFTELLNSTYCNFATPSVAGDFVYAFKNLEITNPHSIAAKMLPDDE